MNIESVRRSFARFGWSRSLRAKGLEVIGRAADFHVLRVELMERFPLDLTLPSRRYTHGFLGEAAIRRFAEDPILDMTPAFIDGALARGDRCYAILDGSVLASFRWFGRHLTPMEHRLACHPGARRVYVYHGFTRPQYRGRRLHANVAARALETFHAEGVDGIIGIVDASNLSSMKSHVRVGARDLGACYALCAAARTFVHVDASVVRHGVRVEVVPDEASAPTGRAGEATRRAA